MHSAAELRNEIKDLVEYPIRFVAFAQKDYIIISISMTPCCQWHRLSFPIFNNQQGMNNTQILY